MFLAFVLVEILVVLGYAINKQKTFRRFLKYRMIAEAPTIYFVMETRKKVCQRNLEKKKLFPSVIPTRKMD
jgi:hypothetical protein